LRTFLRLHGRPSAVAVVAVAAARRRRRLKSRKSCACGCEGRWRRQQAWTAPIDGGGLWEDEQRRLHFYGQLLLSEFLITSGFIKEIKQT